MLDVVTVIAQIMLAVFLCVMSFDAACTYYKQRIYSHLVSLAYAALAVLVTLHL